MYLYYMPLNENDTARTRAPPLSLLQQRRAAPAPVAPRAAALHGLCGGRGLSAQIRVVALQLGRDRIHGHGLVAARRAQQDLVEVGWG